MKKNLAIFTLLASIAFSSATLQANSPATPPTQETLALQAEIKKDFDGIDHVIIWVHSDFMHESRVPWHSPLNKKNWLWVR